MKLSFTTLAVAAMAGSASAGVTFDPPIPFTQFDGDCDEEVVYTGEVVSINKLDYGSFCIADNINTADGPVVAYSKVDIFECDTERIYENWHHCTDDTCGECESEYQAYTNWDSIDPDNLVGFCYDYTFSMDVTEKIERKVTTFNSVRQINFSFDAYANPEDVKLYTEMMDENSCIALGPPLMQSTTNDEPTADEDVAALSGASTLAATAATLAMSAATIVLLA
jgi:hypothetical protein